MKKIGMILAGCGVFDGSEIYETVLTLYFLDKAGIQYQCFAPSIDQLHVINHSSQEIDESLKRNVLLESARLARGHILPLQEIEIAKLDGIIFPGGWGAVKNLCSFATDGPNFKVNPDVENAIKDAYSMKKVIGVMCISPILIAKVLQPQNVTLEMTVGENEEIAQILKSFNVSPISAGPEDIVVDTTNKIVSTPAYMCETNIAGIARGIEKLVSQVANLSS